MTLIGRISILKGDGNIMFLNHHSTTVLQAQRLSTVTDYIVVAEESNQRTGEWDTIARFHKGNAI